MKKIFSMMIATVALTIGLPGLASACGGNMMNCNNYTNVDTGGFVDGYYDATGGAGNDGSGPVVKRGSVSESGGFVAGGFSSGATTCKAKGCSNFAKAGIDGSAFQSSGSYIKSGSAAGSGAGGAVSIGGDASAYYNRN